MQSSRSTTVLEFRSGQAPDKIELLAGLQPQEIDLILSAGRLRRFSPKSVMTRQGNSADHLLLLWRGRARYFFETQNGKKLNLRTITPGRVFGGAALVSSHSSYLVSTEAMQNSVVLVWERPTIRALARRFKLLLENALLAALDHFDWYVSAYAALSSQPARERLARVLVNLAPSIGQKVLGGIELHISNEELADSVNITPYTASRLVSEWKKIGALRKERGKILLRSPERLLLGVV